MNLRKIIREEIEGTFTDIHGKKYSPVDYTAIVIEGNDIDIFEKKMSNRLDELGIKIPSSWKYPDNYHMTITLGELSLGVKMSGVIGRKVEIEVYSVGVSDDAIAVGVYGMFSRNEMQHITLAFRDKPADSKDISKWIEFKPFKVDGYVREINKADGWGKLRNREL